MKKAFLITVMVLCTIVKPALAVDVFLVPSGKPSIQAAIDDPTCTDGDFVIVGSGTYDEMEGFYNVDFKGLAITVMSAGGPEQCIIIPGSGNQGFIFQSGEDANSVLYGFTIKQATGNINGAAVHCSASSPTITDCIIQDNSAEYGGGIYCEASSPTIIDCNITNNLAVYQGGGIYCWNSSPSFTNCNINNNSAIGPGNIGGLGGGIYCEDFSSLTITDCIISDNDANGLYTADLWTELTNDSFETDFGNYTDGGDECFLYAGGTYARDGNNAADIQDDLGDASSFYHTSGIDVDTTGYTQIKVDFWYYPVSFDNSAEDFWVLYYDGSSWQTVLDFDYSIDFSNDSFYHGAVYINEDDYTFPSDMKIKFTCDASGNQDDAYIDSIEVSAR